MRRAAASTRAPSARSGYPAGSRPRSSTSTQGSSSTTTTGQSQSGTVVRARLARTRRRNQCTTGQEKSDTGKSRPTSRVVGQASPRPVREEQQQPAVGWQFDEQRLVVLDVGSQQLAVLAIGYVGPEPILKGRSRTKSIQSYHLSHSAPLRRGIFFPALTG